MSAKPSPRGQGDQTSGSRDEDGFRFLPAPGTAARIWFLTIEHMTVQRLDHVGIVVDDLAAATEFFLELGLKLQGEGLVEGGWVDRVVGSRPSAWSTR